MPTPEPDSGVGDGEDTRSMLDNISYVRGSPMKQEPLASSLSNSLSGSLNIHTVPSLLSDINPNSVASSSTSPWPSGVSSSKPGFSESPSLPQSSASINSQYSFQAYLPVPNPQIPSFGAFPSSLPNSSETRRFSDASPSPKSTVDAGAGTWAFSTMLEEGASVDPSYKPENSLAAFGTWVSAYVLTFLRCSP